MRKHARTFPSPQPFTENHGKKDIIIASLPEDRKGNGVTNRTITNKIIVVEVRV